MSGIKTIAKDWLPPAITRAVRSLRGGGLHFEGDYATWEAAAAQCTGYNAEPILAKVLDATLKVKRGEAAYERDSVLFEEIEYAWPVTGGLMWAAAQSGGRLDVLDFGGALGSLYFQNRAFLAALPQVRWSVVEQAHYVDAGRKHIQDDTLRFYPAIENCLAENHPNVVLLSSVLQYLPQAIDVFKQINNSGAAIVIIDRTPFADSDGDKVCIQRVPDWIYRASYPMRVFSLAGFIQRLDDHWEVVATICSPEGRVTSNTGLDITFQGFLLKRKNV
jgi:putative methyltransferase (TIGR04325 family)